MEKSVSSKRNISIQQLPLVPPPPPPLTFLSPTTQPQSFPTHPLTLGTSRFFHLILVLQERNQAEDGQGERTDRAKSASLNPSSQTRATFQPHVQKNRPYRTLACRMKSDQSLVFLLNFCIEDLKEYGTSVHTLKGHG